MKRATVGADPAGLSAGARPLHGEHQREPL